MDCIIYKTYFVQVPQYYNKNKLCTYFILEIHKIFQNKLNIPKPVRYSQLCIKKLFPVHSVLNESSKCIKLHTLSKQTHINPDYNYNAKSNFIFFKFGSWRFNIKVTFQLPNTTRYNTAPSGGVFKSWLDFMIFFFFLLFSVSGEICRVHGFGIIITDLRLT